MSKLVISAIGPASSIQDGGRHGAQRYGLTPSGAMDPLSLAAANCLVSNAPFAAAIEIGPFGAAFVAREGAVRVALAGAPRSVEIGGRAIAYRRAGSGTPLVFLHGFLCDSRVWRRQLAELADEFDVVANVIESSGDRFLASGAAFDDANGLAEFLLAAALLEPRDFIGARGKNNFGEGFAGSQAAQSVKEDGRAVQFEKLFGRFAAHAGAHSSGGQNGGDSGHRNLG